MLNLTPGRIENLKMPTRKYPESLAIEIREMKAQGYPLKVIAEALSTSYHHVHHSLKNIDLGRRRLHGRVVKARLKRAKRKEKIPLIVDQESDAVFHAVADVFRDGILALGGREPGEAT